MNTVTETNKFTRFQVFIGDVDVSGSVKKIKNVGMSYLGEGQSIFSLRLWSLSWERYFVLPDKKNPSKYVIMTREPSKNPESKNKYYWNIVGNATTDTKNGVMRLDFDLLLKPIYMNLYPEPYAQAKNVPEPDRLDEAV
ncbi:MAG: hypothetical protein K2Q26_12300 [Bdellovibrionales bacterium]|nr:hypothetical protein [Bdellovibrionales bacterium]